MEVWGRLHLYYSDFYYCLLAAGIREVLTALSSPLIYQRCN
jgi:hypothetical protein